MKPGRIAAICLGAALLLLLASTLGWCAEPSRTRGLRADVAWLGLGMAADVGSTEWALGRCSSCAEGNPLLQSAGRRVAAKAVGLSVVGLACYKLRKDGHGRTATVLRWTAVAGLSAVAVHNVRAGQRAGR